MMMHLNLATRDLDAGVAFYRTLLVAEPFKRHDDYALFVTSDPGLELALDADPRATIGNDAHYGIAVETPGAVEAAIVRLRAASYAVNVEREETCCYAVQTKVWATDPDGRRWEVYTVLDETETRGDAGAGCCDTGGDCGCTVAHAGVSKLAHGG